MFARSQRSQKGIWLGRRNGVVVKKRLENMAPGEFASSDDSSFRYMFNVLEFVRATRLWRGWGFGARSGGVDPE